MKSRALERLEIEKRLGVLQQWTLQNGMLHKEYAFEDFVALIGFVVQVAFQAQAMDHHPDMDIRYSRLIVNLSTHSAKGVTDLDFELALRMDRIAHERSV